MSDANQRGGLYNDTKHSDEIYTQLVGKFTRSNMCTDVGDSAQSVLESLIKAYGIQYGASVVCSFCDGAQNVPPLDFAAFLPIDRYNAAKSHGQYMRLVGERLKGCAYGGDVVIMAVNRNSREIVFYNQQPFTEYIDRLYAWSTKCAAEFVMYDDDLPFRSIITPSLRQIAVYSFGSESGGIVSADDCTVGEVCVRLAACILRNKPIDGDISSALATRVRCDDCNLQNRGRLCSIFAAVKRYNASFGVYI